MSNRETYEESIYRIASGYLQTDRYESYLAARNQFKLIPGYKDATEKIEYCTEKLYEYGTDFLGRREFKEAQDCFATIKDYKDSEFKLVEIANKKRIKKRKIMRIVSMVIAVSLVFYTGYELWEYFISPIISYNKAEALLEEGKTVEAAIEFGKAGKFKDARVRSFELWDEYNLSRIALEFDDNVKNYGITANGLSLEWIDYNTGDRKDNNKKKRTVLIECNDGFEVAYYGDKSEISILNDAVAIANEGEQIVYLKNDGTVHRKKETKDKILWKDIKSIATGCDKTYGVKIDGTVVSNYQTEDVKDWKDIVEISATDYHVVGLKSDGTVVAESRNYRKGTECDVSEWTDIVSIVASSSWIDAVLIFPYSTSFHCTVGLKKDGTVVFTGTVNYMVYNDVYYNDSSPLTGIVAIEPLIDTYNDHLAWRAYKSDGTKVIFSLF